MITVRTGSRLHFGLNCFGQIADAAPRPEFGGIGVMVDEPRLELSLTRSTSFHAECPSHPGLADRIRQFAIRWADRCRAAPREPIDRAKSSSTYDVKRTSPARRPADRFSLEADSDGLPKVSIGVIAAPPTHCGFGSGTQLGLAVATGLDVLLRAQKMSAVGQMKAAGRGKRSTIGTYGFHFGGLIVDSGKYPDEPHSRLDCHADVPSTWRWLICCPDTDIDPMQQPGLSGAAEEHAFSRIEPVPETTRKQLIASIQDELLPALRDENFTAFSRALWEYGRLAGSCFSSVQDGAFQGPSVDRLVSVLRAHDVEGVGQSSWGPAVFALMESETQANQILASLQSTAALPKIKTWITTTRARGFELRWHADARPALHRLHPQNAVQ